jgi:hypothetical protein
MILSPTVPNWMAAPQESTYLPHQHLCHRNAATSYTRVAWCRPHQTINLERLFGPLTDSNPIASMLKFRRLSI